MNRFSKEIERKFLLKDLPSDFNLYLKQYVEQSYLFNSDIFSIRIRKYDDNRKYLDFKFGKGIKKFKLKFKLKFWINVKKTIKKIRYKKKVDNVLIVIDFFENGLKIVEIESKDYHKIKNYSIPDWFGLEVSYDKKYKNRNLFKNQL